jgi:succinyl-diaminopimelate desuccinylase
VTLNFGRIDAGVKVNMQPARAEVEFDIRVPPGFRSADVLAEVESIAASHEGHIEVLNFMEPNVSPATDPMVQAFLDAAEVESGRRPVAGPAPGCSDARLWRDRGVPAIGYGPFPNGMGGTDEFCDLAELHVVARTHARVVQDLLMGGGRDE